MSNSPICWFEIYVQDMPRARAFYEGVLGSTLERIGSEDLEMWGFARDPEKSGIGGALVRVPGVPSGGNSTLVYFACEDCAVEEARVESCGGRVERPKMSIGEYGFVTLARDTEGNMFGLWSRR